MATDNKESSKDATKVGTAPSQGNVSPSSTAPQETLTKEELDNKLKELKAGFSRLGSKEKELETKAKDYDTYVKAYPDYIKTKQELEALKKLVATSPAEAFKKVGGKTEDAMGKVISGLFNDNPQAEMISALSEEIKSLKESLTKVEKAKTDEDEAKKRAEFIKQLEVISENYPVVGKSKSYGAVEAELARLKAEGNETVSLEDAVKSAEGRLKEEIKKLVQQEAIKKEELLSWLEKEQAKEEKKVLSEAKPASGAKKVEPPKKDSNEAPKPKTLEDARRRAVKQMKELRAAKG